MRTITKMTVSSCVNQPAAASLLTTGQRQASKQASKQADRQTGRQAGRQARYETMLAGLARRNAAQYSPEEQAGVLAGPSCFLPSLQVEITERSTVGGGAPTVGGGRVFEVSSSSFLPLLHSSIATPLLVRMILRIRSGGRKG
jgi:hypothetical protein